MLTIAQKSNTTRYCDGKTRRNFLQIGALAMGSFSLCDLLRAEAATGTAESQKAIINIHLNGGPSHMDMFDIKSEAPSEYRGEFHVIHTKVPGFQICEHLPQLANMADKFAVIRSVVGMVDDHNNFHTHTGFDRRNLSNAGGRPALGSVVAKLQGPGVGGAPAFVSYNAGSPGYLGPIYKPFHPQGGELRLVGGITEDRLSNRTNLLASLDSIRRDLDSSGQMGAMDAYTQRALQVVTSGRVADALDLSKESKDVVKKYSDDGRSFLTARRLIEAGVRVVSFNWGSWDTHQNNFSHLKIHLPKLDHHLSTLIAELHARGLERDVTIVMWGEFGRTPRINNTAGRDHWSRVASCFLAGGGMRLGQVIGSTSRDGGEAKDRPVHLQEIFATLYHNLGINVNQVQLHDTAGRPQYLLEKRNLISELV